jgi:hypothetical protein
VTARNAISREVHQRLSDGDEDLSWVDSSKWLVEVSAAYRNEPVKLDTQYNVRIMSDVWADVTTVRVLDRKTGKLVKLGSRCSEFPLPHGGFGLDGGLLAVCFDAPQGEVDFLEEVLTVRRRAALFATRLQEADRAHHVAREAAAVPAPGRRVRVVRGRKTPVGTEGLCFWRGGQWDKVGIALTPAKDPGGRYTDVLFVYAKNVVALDPNGNEYR